MNARRTLELAGLLGLALLVAVASRERCGSRGVTTAPAYFLTLEEVQAWVDRAHPLLEGTEREKVIARGKLLKALGAFRASAGYQRAVGEAIIPDLVFGRNNQALLGVFIPLLRGLLVNPDR